jgi:hypothetical protein
MGLFSKDEDLIIKGNFKLLEEVGGLPKENMYTVKLYNDKLTISAPLIKTTVELNYNQITDVFHGYETEITTQNKSSIKRALVGGLLFGGIGAVVGAVDGTGTKEKKKIHLCFIISYTSSSGEEAYIQFEDVNLYKGNILAKKLKELCHIEDVKPNDKVVL